MQRIVLLLKRNAILAHKISSGEEYVRCGIRLIAFLPKQMNINYKRGFQEKHAS